MLMFEGWDHIDIYQTENSLTVFIETEYEYSHNPIYPIV